MPISSPRSPAKDAAYQTELAIAATKNDVERVTELLDGSGNASTTLETASDDVASTALEKGSLGGSPNSTTPKAKNPLSTAALNPPTMQPAACTTLAKASDDGATACTAIVKGSPGVSPLSKLPNAACTILVKGSLEGSLLCTLPNARKPLSTAVKHPPLETISPAIIEAIDASLAKHITATPLYPPLSKPVEVVVPKAVVPVPKPVPVPVPVPVPAPVPVPVPVPVAAAPVPIPPRDQLKVPLANILLCYNLGVILVLLRHFGQFLEDVVPLIHSPSTLYPHSLFVTHSFALRLVISSA
jgi:hypothetical protein